MRKNASSADNQQGSPLSFFKGYDPSETTRRAPFSKKAIKDKGFKEEGDDIVHAL